MAWTKKEATTTEAIQRVSELKGRMMAMQTFTKVVPKPVCPYPKGNKQGARKTCKKLVQEPEMIGNIEVLPSENLLNSTLDIKAEIAKAKKGSKNLLCDAIQAAHKARKGTCAASDTDTANVHISINTPSEQMTVNLSKVDLVGRFDDKEMEDDTFERLAVGASDACKMSQNPDDIVATSHPSEADMVAISVADDKSLSDGFKAPAPSQKWKTISITDDKSLDNFKVPTSS
ncbi:hypothetical protein HD554DRAFT_2040819 [Boletus coccyginus]|nr:hypothetical protein HD554DRAFT_2040819 [Boletus coccyginus]